MLVTSAVVAVVLLAFTFGFALHPPTLVVGQSEENNKITGTTDSES